MSGLVLIIAIFVVIIGLYVGSYLLNSKTPAPIGVEQQERCGSCGAGGCSMHSDPNPNDSMKKTIQDYNL